MSKQHLVGALDVVRPSAMREVLLEVPKVHWEDIGGQADVKQKLKEVRFSQNLPPNLRAKGTKELFRQWSGL